MRLMSGYHTSNLSLEFSFRFIRPPRPIMPDHKEFARK